MKTIHLAKLIIWVCCLLPLSTLQAQETFCDNLPKIVSEVGFKESFQQIKGELVSTSHQRMLTDTIHTNIYKPTQDLIPGVPASIIHKDYPGDLDTWEYRIDYSAGYSREDQEKSMEYWKELIPKCLNQEEGWTFKEEERKYDSEENIKVWSATRKMDGYFGFRMINVQVVLFEEFDDSFRRTGRFGLKFKVF